MVGFIILFVIGGVNGVMTAPVPFDLQLTDTYFIVAHIPLRVARINVFPSRSTVLLAAEDDGADAQRAESAMVFWLMFIGMNLAFFPCTSPACWGCRVDLHVPLRDGMGQPPTHHNRWCVCVRHRRGALPHRLGSEPARGAACGNQPMDAPTLEWSTTSPPPPYNFAVLPTVRSRYPLWEERLHEDATSIVTGPVLDDGRETIGTSALDAEPTPCCTCRPILRGRCFCARAHGRVLCPARVSWTWTGIGFLLVFICLVGWLSPSGTAARGEA